MSTSTDPRGARASLDIDEGSPLRGLAALAAEAGAREIAADAEALAERVADGRFYVACLGQFKRGKSTLLNALVGEPILPMGVVPVTSVVTILRHGPKRGACVQFADGRAEPIDLSEIGAYVTEGENPGNRKGIASVEVFLASPLLAGGMCLVDTPGLGSVFAANTEATRTFVPHIDAALVVLGADPPISGDELGLVIEAAQHLDHFLFVLNKADRLSDAERAEAGRFAERILQERLRRPVGPILHVSAAERLTLGRPTRDWGWLEGMLEALAKQSGSHLVHTAEERGLRRLGERLLDELEEERSALLRPLEQSERRIAMLRACAAEAEQSMRDLGYLMTAEQERLAKRFADKKQKFLEWALPFALRELSDSLSRQEIGRRALRKQAFALAQQISQECLDRWRSGEQLAAEALYAEASDRFVQLANDFLHRLSESGDPSLGKLPRAIGPELGFRVKSRLFYTEMLTSTARSPLRWLLDLLRPRASARRAIEREVREYLERLLSTNASRIERDLDDRVAESRHRLEAEIRASLKEIYASAERALERARTAQAAGDAAVRRELGRIETLGAKVRAILLQAAEGRG